MIEDEIARISSDNEDVKFLMTITGIDVTQQRSCPKLMAYTDSAARKSSHHTQSSYIGRVNPHRYRGVAYRKMIFPCSGSSL
jgi:hypothetical protein